MVIARIWTATVPTRHTDGFETHLRRTGVEETAAITGNRGAQILRRSCGERTQFTLITFWDSYDAIRAFAGDDIDTAVLYPGDEAYELEPSLVVEHHDVLMNQTR